MTFVAALVAILLAQEANVEAMISAIRARETAVPRARAVIVGGQLPNDFSPFANWGVDDLIRAKRHELVWDGPRLRDRRMELGVAVPPMLSDEGVSSSGIWTGDMWIARNVAKRSCVIKVGPNLQEFDCLAFVLGIPWPSLASPYCLSRSLDMGKVLNHTLENSHERLTRAPNEDGTLELTVVWDHERRTVSEVILTMLASQGALDAGQPTTIIRYYVVEWDNTTEPAFPRRAIRESTIYVNESVGISRDQPPRVYRFAFILESMDHIESAVPEVVFAKPPLHPGDSVGDLCLHVSYTIGEDYLAVNDELFRCSEVITDYVSAEDVERLFAQSALARPKP